MTRIALVTGASSGFGRMIATDLAAAGLTAYASMREVGGNNAGTVAEIADQAKTKGIDLRPVELDVQNEASVEQAVATVHHAAAAAGGGSAADMAALEGVCERVHGHDGGGGGVKRGDGVW